MSKPSKPVRFFVRNRVDTSILGQVDHQGHLLTFASRVAAACFVPMDVSWTYRNVGITCSAKSFMDAITLACAMVPKEKAAAK